jgi:hypothetical protein
VQLALAGEEGVRGPELGAVGELEVVEEVDHLLERGVLREVRDVVPDVPQAPRLPVDVGDARLRRNDLAEPLFGHGTRIIGPWGIA